MILSELKEAIRSRIWEIMNENSWKELDDFSLVLADKLSKKIITGSKPKFQIILKQIKTNFFRINKISREEFTKELKSKLDYLYKLFKKPKKLKIRKEGKEGKRKNFSIEDQQETLRKQDHLCAKCGKLSSIIDFDHKDGDRTNNHITNCQALCPNCHGRKSRRNQMGLK